MTESNLTVAVIDPSRARAAILEEGLRAAGIGRVVVIPDTADLMERVAALNPDVVVIHLESPSRDILEQMSGVSRQVERPVALRLQILAPVDRNVVRADAVLAGRHAFDED